MPWQVTFVKDREGSGGTTQTTGIVTTLVKVGWDVKLKNQEGWWKVVKVSEIPWIPISQWKVGGL